MLDEAKFFKGVKVPNLDEVNVKEDIDLPSMKAKILETLKLKSSGEKHGLLSTGKIPMDKTREELPVAIKPGKNRIDTGIEGLDEVMGGGFEPESVNIIGGGPGSGKSILCMQFLVNGIKKFNENGIYITFEESSLKLKKHLSQFGWGLEKLEEEGKLTIIEYTPEQVNLLLEEGGGIIDTVLEKTHAKRLVVDSLTAFTLLFRDEYSRIEASLKLFKLIDRWGCTAVLTAESDPLPERHKSTMIEFEVDGVILLYNMRKEDTRKRALEILKLRGIHHSTKIFPMKIEEKGIVLYPEAELF